MNRIEYKQGGGRGLCSIFCANRARLCAFRMTGMTVCFYGLLTRIRRYIAVFIRS